MNSYFHGTSARHARTIQERGLQRGAFVTTDFDLAASYALKHAEPAIVILTGEVAEPRARAYDGEYIALNMRATGVPCPQFADVPDDFYELNDSLSGRKYPDLFDRKQWQ